MAGVRNLRARLSVVLGRTIDKDELQGDLLVELLELVERERAGPAGEQG
jgi:hypothetical protein